MYSEGESPSDAFSEGHAEMPSFVGRLCEIGIGAFAWKVGSASSYLL